MPSRPGEELTSIICGPSAPSSISTPATRSPMICVQRTAVSRNSSLNSTGSATPPRCTLLRNSCPWATRRMAATTWSPTTKARISRPLLSATNFWIRTFCFWLCSNSIIDSACLTDSASNTPIPWVPSMSLMITGAPPTLSIAGSTSFLSRTNVVRGRPTPCRLSICRLRSLSLELLIPWAVFAQNTSIS